MKNIFAVILTTLLINLVNAQYYLLPPVQNGQNPSNLNRDVEAPQGGGLNPGWQTILQGPQASGNWSATFQIPFRFLFNGALVRNFKASTSGVVTFNTRTGIRVDSNNVALPSSKIPDSSICIWGLRAAAGDFIIQKTFGKAPHRQHWISYNSFSEQNLQSGGHIYASVVLEESTNKIFIVDQRTICRANGVDCNDKTNLTLGIQIDSTNAIMVPGSPDYASVNANSPNTSDNVYHAFIPGPIPELDIEAQSLDLQDYYLIREFPISLSGNFKNIGSATINQLSFHYQVDNGPVESASLTGLNVSSLEAFRITHPKPWALSDSRYNAYTIRAWISQINDQPAAFAADDTISYTLIVNDTFFTRKLLHETFTSSSSQPARIANDTLHRVLGAFPGLYSEVNYPMGSPQGGDPYFTIESAARGRIYNIGNFSIPSTIMDGSSIGNASQYNTQTFQTNQQIPALCQIHASGKVKGQDIEVELRFINEAPLARGTKLYVAICEKQTTKNVKTNGETFFLHVMKKMLPDTLGILIDSLPADSSGSFQLQWTVPGNYRLPADGRTNNIINLETEHSIEDFSNLEVIAWLQESDRTVLQSNSADLQYTVSNDHAAFNREIRLMPNPVQDYVHVDLSAFQENHKLSLSILDAQGRLIHHQKTSSKSLWLSTNQWTPGLYVLKASNGSQGGTAKMWKVE
ncbi:MAG TPA: T9SS type A sorting domain-containing protein [Saprospiraceae bacterium]|nr:T9SS type A sorting domain-containing protein [Saprospiraceae bacterium]